MSFEIGQIIDQSSREYTFAAIKANNGEFLLTDQGNETSKIEAMPVVEPLTLSEQASKLSMRKADFVYMVEAMTTSFSMVDPTVTPITFEVIWGWCQSDMKVMQLFVTENTVHRADPMLDATTGKFAPQFAHFLDLMFVEQQAIMQEIGLAKTENRPMDLMDTMAKWNIVIN